MAAAGKPIPVAAIFIPDHVPPAPDMRYVTWSAGK